MLLLWPSFLGLLLAGLGFVFEVLVLEFIKNLNEIGELGVEDGVKTEEEVGQGIYSISVDQQQVVMNKGCTRGIVGAQR